MGINYKVKHKLCRLVHGEKWGIGFQVALHSNRE